MQTASINLEGKHLLKVNIDTSIATDNTLFRGVNRGLTPATSIMESSVTLISRCKPLNNITKNSNLDVSRVMYFSDACSTK